MPETRVTLPQDDGAHRREPWEWWYWTGHLQAPGGRWFGFEQVFFRVFQGRWPTYMGHFALSDIQGGRFHHSMSRNTPARFPTFEGFDLTTLPQRAKGGGGLDVLHGEVDGWVMDAELRELKPPMLQHTTGYTDYAEGGYTYYYSRPRMAVTGTLRQGDLELPVEGTAWFDHQWGDLARVMSLGWDWFALQLDDGRDLMLITLGPAWKRTLFSASISERDGSFRELRAQDVQITATGEWTSPRSRVRYPLGWQVDVEGMRFTVEPVMVDQELMASTMVYWEGAALIRGDVTGRAYIELVSYDV